MTNPSTLVEHVSALPVPETPLLEAALSYAKRGWKAFPLKPGEKSPLHKGGFHSASDDREVVNEWWQRIPQPNIGLFPGPSGLIVFDIDSAEAEEVAQRLGLLGVPTLTVRTGRIGFAGRHLYFQRPDIGFIGNLRLGFRDDELIRVGQHGLEVKADAGYVVAPPSVHPSGQRYEFVDVNITPALLPVDALAALRSLVERSTSVARIAAPRQFISGREEGVSLADVERWLKALSPDRCDSYDDWIKVLMALHHQFAGTDDEANAIELAIEWSQQSWKYQPGDVEDKWRSFAESDSKPGITIRSLRHWANEDSNQREGYPVINCTVASETRLTVPTWEAIRDRNAVEPCTFWHNGSLARLRPSTDGTVSIERLTLDTLAQHLAANVADFERRNQPCYPPQMLLSHLLANPKPPVELPEITRVVPVPIFAANGELMTTPGYHAASKTYYAPLPSLGRLRSVSQRPSADEVRDAVRIFDEHVGANFPFANDGGASRAHALSLAIQPFVMDVIDQIVPLYDVEANQRRTGKGLLTQICLMPAFGPTLAAKRMPMPKAEDEVGKVIVASLRDGGQLVVFDNVKGPVSSASLESVLTAEYFEGRILGISTMTQARNRATWVMIANNPEMSGDLSGRAIRIRLVSPVEFPEDRTDFKQLQPRYTQERLPDLIWALHTLIRHWFVQGCPGPAPGTPGMGSYPRWREVVGGILHAAGIEGFLRNREIMRCEISQTEMQWREFVHDWLRTYGVNDVLTSELVALAESHDIMLGGESERARSTALGSRLGRAADVRYFDRYTIERSKPGGERGWRLVDHGEPGVEGLL